MTRQPSTSPPASFPKWLHPILIKTGPLFFYVVFYSLFFYPVLSADSLLAPIDGIIQSVPPFFAAKSLWTANLYSGFPIAADPTIEFWYPPAQIFSFPPFGLECLYHFRLCPGGIFYLWVCQCTNPITFCRSYVGPDFYPERVHGGSSWSYLNDP